MPYKTRRCSVKGCPSTSLNHKQFHHFPKEAERSRTWTRLCGNESLLGIPAAEMHKKYHVCSLHFSREQYFNNEQLRLRFYLGGAVPDQLLGDPLSEELIECWWKAGRLEEFYREPVHQSRRKSKYDVSDISGMTPLPTLSGSNNAGMSGCQEEVVLFDTLDQNKPESCASECVDEGFAPMEYLDHLRSHNDLNHQPLLSQTNPTVTLKLNTSEANLTPAPINSGSNVGTSHYEENLLLLEASDQSLKNGSPYSLKKSSVEHANAPGTWGSLLKGVEAPCTLDSSSEDSDSPCKLDSPFRHFDEGFAPMEYLDYVDYNKSGPTPYRTKCHIGALTLSDFKTEKRAERSLGMVKSKFKQMQHQNRQLQQKLKQAQNKIKKLQLMLLASARKDSDQK